MNCQGEFYDFVGGPFDGETRVLQWCAHIAQPLAVKHRANADVPEWALYANRGGTMYFIGRTTSYGEAVQRMMQEPFGVSNA